jgi:hypothetical protein
VERTLQAALCAATLVVCTPIGRADCAGASIRTNPWTTLDEKVWQVHDGQDYEIRHAEKINGAWSNEVQLTANELDESCPALAFSPTGGSAVVWKSASSPSRVHYRARKLVAGVWTWQPEAVPLGEGTNPASTPYVLFHDGDPWVIWRETLPGGSVQVLAADDPGGEPWPVTFTPHVIATISDPGVMALDLNSEDGVLWATWVASQTTLHYAVWNSAGSEWSAPSAVTIQGGDVAAAKAQAREEVLE